MKIRTAIIAIITLSFVFAFGLVSALRAEVINAWEFVEASPDNPFGNAEPAIGAGAAWIGGRRGVVIKCSKMFEITDFDWSFTYYGEMIDTGIAVNGEIVFATVGRVLELANGKTGVETELSSDNLDKLIAALETTAKPIYINGLYESAQKITPNGSTAAAKKLRASCDKLYPKETAAMQ